MKKLFLVFLLFSAIYFSETYSVVFPTENWSQQYPEKAWGAIYIKNISTRVEEGKIVAVNVYKINDISASPGYGPFSQVSQTFSVDYNNDGYADIISLTYDGWVVIKENKMKETGDLSLENVRSYELPVRNGDGSMIVDDFDNDGKLDLFAFNSWQYAQFVDDVLNQGQASDKKIKKDNKFVTKWTVSAMASYDYNGDGYKDIFYVDYKGRFWVWINDPTKGVERFFNKNNIVKLFEDKDLASNGGGGVLDLGDLNNDGIVDLIAGHTDKKSIFVYFGKIANNQLIFDVDNKFVITTENGSLSEYVTVDPLYPNSKSPENLPSFGPTIIKITDVDRDGFKDVFVGTDAWRQGKNFGGSVYLFKGVNITSDNKPKFVSLELVHGSYSFENNPPYDFDAGTIADLDNDGVPDFVAADGNHSGNFYKIITQTQKEYELEKGYMVSDYLPKLAGILPKDLPNNFVKKIKVTIKFDLSLGDGSFEIRYVKSGIKDPQLIDPESYPLMPNASGTVLDTFTTEIEFDKPVPDPQIIIILKPASPFSAPHISYLKYEIETQPSQVIIKGFNWQKGDK
ncbi:alpha integrin [Thermosipho melanesiensis]|uniref:FG-GAP repeat protein n=2 Tax=Thermosipho melanesiensis TaxID=46541 RepID=A6LLF5_THEM4|nr:VCBS repeat-containing protein [Thermosipho melanesiensis]ABR30756.1 FG-GAP repeat protein [Thermosipho melanesiensis BI429]APT73879.1 alpha integrin [Thermosipho melanesiensis]OOC35820.1 alpha integrin [Thermosipho melanesiensis]OOC38322.1 alpha integrin [Thermosipho melanesiensis]OOC38783.1 alpha integrin [Thermosipho melanesiensis]